MMITMMMMITGHEYIWETAWGRSAGGEREKGKDIEG
jgi:hypothetical protein